MKTPLDAAALDTLFRNARSYNRWTQDPVPESKLRALYDLLKMGPTSANCCPARFVFVASHAGKQKLLQAKLPRGRTGVRMVSGAVNQAGLDLRRS